MAPRIDLATNKKILRHFMSLRERLLAHPVEGIQLEERLDVIIACVLKQSITLLGSYNPDGKRSSVNNRVYVDKAQKSYRKIP